MGGTWRARLAGVDQWAGQADQDLRWRNRGAGETDSRGSEGECVRAEVESRWQELGASVGGISGRDRWIQPSMPHPEGEREGRAWLTWAGLMGTA